MWLRSWRRQAGQSIVGAMRRRASLAMLLFAAVVVLPALAHASPPDPSWVAGFWDDADSDDVVLAVTGMTAAPQDRSTGSTRLFPYARAPDRLECCPVRGCG